MDSQFSLTFLKHKTNSNVGQINATFITPISQLPVLALSDLTPAQHSELHDSTSHTRSCYVDPTLPYNHRARRPAGFQHSTCFDVNAS